MKKLWKNKKLIIILSCLTFVIGGFGFLSWADKKIDSTTDALVFSDVKEVLYHRVGLLLGTAKTAPSGLPNAYFVNRIKAALELYQAKKLDYIVVSGDNGRKTYNEPEDMKKALVEAGVPAEKIYLDYAGFRTHDSVIRMNKIFGQKDFIIISQEFHNRRAIYIAKHYGLEAVGYNARDVRALVSLKVQLRERLSRANVFLDLLIDRQPKFLGEKIEVK